jgi:hypothetical protein
MGRRRKKYDRGEQVRTRFVSAEWIMTRRAFMRGVDDVRSGRSYPRDYDTWKDINYAWNYERGRQWGAQAPRDLPVRLAGKLNRKAVEWFRRADIL